MLWEGKVDHHGQFFNVKVTFPSTSHIPVLISTLGKKAFQLAGEIADGALSFMCPVPYLIRTAIPTMHAAASCQLEDQLLHWWHMFQWRLVRIVILYLLQRHQLFDMYWKFPFYAKMFADAGFPLTASQMISDSLIDSLIVSGNEDTVAVHSLPNF